MLLQVLKLEGVVWLPEARPRYGYDFRPWLRVFRSDFNIVLQVLDQCLSEHVMALHSGMADRAQAARQRLLEYRPTTQQQLALPAPPGLGSQGQPALPPLAVSTSIPVSMYLLLRFTSLIVVVLLRSST